MGTKSSRGSVSDNQITDFQLKKKHTNLRITGEKKNQGYSPNLTLPLHVVLFALNQAMYKLK